MDGIVIRLALLSSLALSATISAVLGFSDSLDQNLKIALVGANAGLVVVANQLASWQNAPRVDRAIRRGENSPLD